MLMSELNLWWQKAVIMLESELTQWKNKSLLFKNEEKDIQNEIVISAEWSLIMLQEIK